MIKRIIASLVVLLGIQCSAQSVSGKIDGYEYVDLGLPSGLKWATMNVGASSPEECGDYFAWGEVKTKEEYDKFNSVTYGKSIDELQADGVIDSNGNLNPYYDAATQKWGKAWRMPTWMDFYELLIRCRWEWTTFKGKDGYKVSSKVNDNWIFFPDDSKSKGNGYYWSSTASVNNEAYLLYFYHLKINNSYRYSYNFDNDDRYQDNGVRPVTK